MGGRRGLVTSAAALLAAAARLSCASGFPYTLPLVRLGDDGMVGNVSLGSPPQPLVVQVDTLSSDLWVPAPESGMPTPLHHVFTAGLSATYHDDGANMTLPYSPRLNASVRVEVSDDTLGLAGVVVVNVTFGVATAMDRWFYAVGFDGILGLGLDGAGRISRTTVLDRLVRQRGLEPMFSLFVAPTKLQQQAALAEALVGSADAGAAAAATLELDAKPSADSALLLGGYDMRYTYAPKERPLWIPLLDLGAPAPPLRAAPFAGTGAGDTERASLPTGSGAGVGIGSTTWRVWLPHFTLDCGAPASAGVAATLSRGWRALSRWASAAQPSPALGDGSDACVGSAEYVAWAAAAVPALRPHVMPFPGHAAAPAPARPAAPSAPSRRPAPLRDAPGTLDVCGYNAPSDSTLCSGLVTSSMACLGVPGALLPTLVAAVNVSCGGQCVVVPGVGAGLLCPLGTCGDTALPGGGVVPAGMPRLTLTLSTAGSPGGDPTADGSDLTDVPLMPADYTRVLAAEVARAAARRALDEAVAAAAAGGKGAELPSWAAGAARVAGGDAFPAAYWRVMVQPFDPFGSGGGDDLPWLLGTPFLSAFYTVFDASGMQLGFAPTVAAHEPAPSRYIDADTGAGFWGRPVMWAAVVSALFVGLGCVGSFYVARHRRHARRAEAVEEEHRERLLLGVQLDAPGEADGSGGGGSSYEYDYTTLGPDGGGGGGGVYAGEQGGSHRLVDDGVAHGSGGSVVFFGGRGGVAGGDSGGGHRHGPTIIGLHGVGQAGARSSYAPPQQLQRHHHQQQQQPTFGSGFGVSLGAYSSGGGAGASVDGAHANSRGAGGGGGVGLSRGLQRLAPSAAVSSSPASPGSDAGEGRGATAYLRIAAPASGGGASGRGGTPRYLAAGGSDSPSQSPQQGLANSGSPSSSRGVPRRAATPLGGIAGSFLPGGSGAGGGGNQAAVAHAARRLDFTLGGGQAAGTAGSLTPGAGRRAPSTSGEALHGLGGLASPLVGSLPLHVVGSTGSGGGGAGGGSYYFDA